MILTRRFVLRRLTMIAIVGLSTASVTWATETLPFVAAVESWLADYRIATLLPAEPQDPNLAIVAITEETISRFAYREPVDRHFLAQLLRTLEARGVRGILLDLVFDQPTEPEKDLELRQTLAGLKVPVVISMGDTGHGLTEEQVKYLNEFVPPPLRGIASLITDPLDGTVRTLFPGLHQPDGRLELGVVSALAAKLGYPVPESEQPIAWRGRPDTESKPFASYRADLVPLLPAGWLKNRIVLIGADLALTDRHRTPFSTVLPGQAGKLAGVAIHAHTLAQLIEGRHAESLDRTRSIVLIAGAGLAGSLMARLAISLMFRLPLSVAALLGLWVAGFVAFRDGNLMIPLIAPSLGFLLGQWLTDIYFGGQQRQQRQFIERAFGRYLSRDLVRQLMHDPARLRLGGERRMMTILVTDIAGFTSLSERLDPETISKLLNAYFEGICTAVLDHGGMINEFLGDSVLAFFGAPIAQPDHAARAIACARAIDRFAERFRSEHQAVGIGFGSTRIGVHTGEAMVGNFGSKERFKYVALGDTVNTASRLEGLNRHFGTRILCSATSLGERADPLVRPLAEVVLKGRTAALAVFEILPEPPPTLDRYRAAYSLMATGAPAAALTAFTALAAETPADPLIAFHHHRLAAGAGNAVVVMGEK